MATDPVEPPLSGEPAKFRDGQPAQTEGRDRDAAPRAIIAVLALVAALIFILQNRNRVETTFLIFDGHPRLWVVIIVSLLLGALLGQAVGLLWRRRKSGD